MGADRGVGSRIFTGNTGTGDSWRQPVRLRDDISAAKPTGSVTIDGVTPLANGDRVLFTLLSGGEAADNNRVYRAVVSGGLVTGWTLDTDGQPNGYPQDGNLVYVKEGTSYGDKIYKWTGSGWSEVGSGGGALSAGGSGAVQFSDGIGGFSADTSNFFWDNTNKRLGIGTTTPGGSLDIISTSAQFFVRSTSTSFATYVGFVNTPGSATAFFGIENGSGTFLFGSGIPYSLAIGTVHAAAVSFHTSNVTTPRMLISSGGNIGIGTTNPLHRLHVVVPNGTAYALHGQMSAGELGIRLDANANVAVMGVISSGRVFFGSQNPTTVEIRTNNVERWRWDTNGHYFPIVSGSYDIGGSSNRVRDLYLSASYIYGSNANQYIQFYSGGELVISGSSFTQVVARSNSFLLATVNLSAPGDFEMGSNLSGVGYGTLNANVNSGAVLIRSGDTSGTGSSGNWTLRSGNASGSGNSGNLTLQVGTVVSGTRGTIRLVDGSLAGSSVGWVWTLQDTATGRGAWAAASGGGGPTWTKYTVTYTDLSLAGTTNDIQLFSLPAKGVIHSVVISHTTNFAGPAITAYTVSVGIASNLTKYAAPFDVLQAAGDSIGQANSNLDFENKSSATSIRVAATSTGANLSAATQGSVEIWVLTSTLT